MTPDQVQKLTAFHNLPDKNRSDIFAAIQNLEQMRVSGYSPSPNEIFDQLSATGHLEIGLACYVAQLSKIKWSTK